VTRLERLGAALEEPLLVTGGVNVRYLTGLSSSNATLLVEPGGAATLYTDFRYLEKAAAVEGVEVVRTARDMIGALATALSGRRIGFEPSHVTFAGHERLAGGGIDLVPADGLVEALRRVKEPSEIEAIRRAAAVSDEVYSALAKERFTGRTERELAWWIEQAFHEAGADGLAFGSIVASGPNGASPHAEPSDRVIDEGTLVTVDAGCVVDGYCSDCTRTFSTGELPAALADAYTLCLEGQLAGLAAVRPGASGRDVDAVSRIPIDAAGLGERYGHGLGHGVGLEVHEAPALGSESKDVLEVGNIVTVEPGIYLPGVGGVRIEDLVLVTADGSESLTRFTKELTTVG
jgi:Xaa-Pro aminopeptidase